MATISRKSLYSLRIGLCCMLAVCFLARYYIYNSQHKHSRTSTVKSSTSQNDNGKQLPYVPFFIGIGQGTTGTKSMFSAFCELGIPTVHFHAACVSPPPSSSSTSTTMEQQHSTEMAGVKAQARVIEDFYAYQKCFNWDNCTLAQGIEILQGLKRHVAQVVTSGIVAVLDTPFPYIVPFIMEVLEKQQGGKPILVFTDRNIDDWVESRTKNHASAIVLQNDAPFALDCAHRLERLLSEQQQQGNNDNANEQCSTIFTSYIKQKSLEDQNDFKAYFKQVATFHQERMLALKPEYQINLFDFPTEMNTSEIAADVWKKTKSFLPAGAFPRVGTPLQKQMLKNLLSL